MVKKSLGYVELEWECPNCDTRNPGSREKCKGCGAPQPANVPFLQPAQEVIIEEEEQIADARSGPDIHCGYCGARNDASTASCRQCGGDLTAGQVRSTGNVLGAHQDGPVDETTCPACGSKNPNTMRHCRTCGSSLAVSNDTEPGTSEKAEPVADSRGTGTGRRGKSIGMLLLAGLVVAITAFIFLSLQTDEVVATVDEITWERSIEVEGLIPVIREDWLDEIPAGAEVGLCSSKEARTQSEPAPGAVEVCGTPYTVDQGSGYGEVIQDCEYKVYEDWCEYTAEEWQPVDTLTAEGTGLQPIWPVLELSATEREAERSEEIFVIFQGNDEIYRYKVDNVRAAGQFEVGSRYHLTVNTFNAVTSVEPALAR